MVLVQVLIGLAVPNFDKILNLIGGSLITLCTFVLPPVMYMKLVNDRSDKTWPKRCVCVCVLLFSFLIYYFVLSRFYFLVLCLHLIKTQPLFISLHYLFTC